MKKFSALFSLLIGSILVLSSVASENNDDSVFDQMPDGDDVLHLDPFLASKVYAKDDLSFAYDNLYDTLDKILPLMCDQKTKYRFILKHKQPILSLEKCVTSLFECTNRIEQEWRVFSSRRLWDCDEAKLIMSEDEQEVKKGCKVLLNLLAVNNTRAPYFSDFIDRRIQLCEEYLPLLVYFIRNKFGRNIDKTFRWAAVDIRSYDVEDHIKLSSLPGKSPEDVSNMFIVSIDDIVLLPPGPPTLKELCAFKLAQMSPEEFNGIKEEDVLSKAISIRKSQIKYEQEICDSRFIKKPIDVICPPQRHLNVGTLQEKIKWEDVD